MSSQQDVSQEVETAGRGGYVVPAGQLPLTEFLFDRAGAASPFGDDLSFPLPVSDLTYVHPSAEAAPQHL